MRFKWAINLSSTFQNALLANSDWTVHSTVNVKMAESVSRQPVDVPALRAGPGSPVTKVGTQRKSYSVLYK